MKTVYAPNTAAAFSDAFANWTGDNLGLALIIGAALLGCVLRAL